VRRRASKREILRRLEVVEAQLSQRPVRPLAGQQALDVATVHDHHYEGAGGPCTAEWFAVPCRERRAAHKLIDEESA
jgi:hypothetical protein